MKKFIPAIYLFIACCAGIGSKVETYKVGEYSVYLASQKKVNQEYQRVCLLNCSRSVKGFVNYRNKEMWSIRSIPVVIHEVKHIVEGRYHKKTLALK